MRLVLVLLISGVLGSPLIKTEPKSTFPISASPIYANDTSIPPTSSALGNVKTSVPTEPSVASTAIPILNNSITLIYSTYFSTDFYGNSIEITEPCTPCMNELASSSLSSTSTISGEWSSIQSNTVNGYIKSESFFSSEAISAYSAYYSSLISSAFSSSFCKYCEAILNFEYLTKISRL